MSAGAVRIISGLILLTAFLSASLAAPGAKAAGDCTIDEALDSEERAFLQLINDYRAANGRSRLGVSWGLTRAAAWKSKDLADNSYFAHDDLTRSWVDRIRDCGYPFGTWLGENIAAGNGSAAATFAQWQGSPGHNANMLSANYTTIGIGRFYNASSPYGWYWTTDFGGVDDGYAVATDLGDGGNTPDGRRKRTGQATACGPADVRGKNCRVTR